MHRVNITANAIKLIHKSAHGDLVKHFFEGPIKTYIHFGLAPEEIKYSEEEREFRVVCLNEEYDEFVKAVNENNRDEKTDAIVDLLIFAIGTSYRMGLLANTIDSFPVIDCSSVQCGFKCIYTSMNDIHIQSLGFLLSQLNSPIKNDIYVINQIIAYCIYYLSLYENERTLFEYYNRVINANMSKVIGPLSKRGSFAIDLVKPEGWVAPSFVGIFR